MNTTLIAVAIAIAVAGAGGYAAARVTTSVAVCVQQQTPKADGLNDAERRFLDVPDQPTTGHKRFP